MVERLELRSTCSGNPALITIRSNNVVAQKRNSDRAPRQDAFVSIRYDGIIDDGIQKKEFRKVDSQVAALHFLSTIRTTFFASVFMHTKKIRKDAVLDVFFNGLIERR